MLLHFIFLPDDKPKFDSNAIVNESDKSSQCDTEENVVTVELNQQLTADSKLCEISTDNSNKKVRSIDAKVNYNRVFVSCINDACSTFSVMHWYSRFNLP